MIIAVDGPAASGKSTLALRLAEALGYLYFDTGVMYRAVTLAVLVAGLNPADEEKVSDVASGIDLDVRASTVDDGRQYDVVLDGRDITWEIRSAEVDQNVSQVSTYRGVRTAMTEIQRQIGLRGEVVMVGRDIGTVVLPEADLKLYLDASVEARAQRRFDECLARGESVKYEDILAWMRERDRIDSTRDLAPLKPAADALILDSTKLNPDQVFTHALKMVREKQASIEGQSRNSL
jgi:cytidylate kinase